ncbi:hypothetical protein UFOVP965_36 [uncultured Caudovirales phage]|uniref:IraD/Gp25-like domain-containing protein n=1 Tax=uncultured Caudovirales phage TaxID=2100421 RepID=A0A6J5PR46_9CAUD|nr:hypothetical protein UFOVP965_36 [uncultured Caudovirales phage]CAB4179751.1 hypothetical protein UFOVP1035_32 [uncultured Caudovirales phage]CAB4188867.1 hypothetical protein UFOVP1181_138 [uncultured Caudovirales phage]
MTSKAISLPFAFDAGGSLGDTIDDAKIWQDRVVVAVMTTLRERVMRPAFGGTIKDSLFETYDVAQSFINSSVSLSFVRWLPDLTLTRVDLDTDDSEGDIVVTIFYTYNRAVEGSVQIKAAVFNRAAELLLEVPTNG